MGADWFVCIQAVFLRGSLVSRESVLGVGADWFVGVQAVFLWGSLVSRGSVLGVGVGWFVGIQAVFLLRQPGVCLGRGLVCAYKIWCFQQRRSGFDSRRRCKPVREHLLLS